MSRPADPIRVYGHPLSGHAHRVELMCALLGLPTELITVDLLQGEQRQPEFLARNPFGQVPVIEDGGETLADSNAILVYLARRYDDSGRWYPEEPVAAAAVQRWLSLAAGPLAAGPATARLIKVFNAPRDRDQAVAVAETLLERMEQHLSTRHFLVGETPTIADVAMYSYTARAPEGDLSLQPYPAIRRWLERIEALDGFSPMILAAA